MSATDHFRPACPAPVPRRAAAWRRLFRPRVSWLDLLHERSYRMKMGEVHVPGLDVYLVNEPTLVRHVLVHGHTTGFERHHAVVDAMRPLVGDAPFTSEGEAWRRQRQAFGDALAEAAPGAARAASAAAGALVERLSASRGEPVDIEREARRACADAMARTLLSRPLDEPGDLEAERLLDALSRFESATARIASPALGATWIARWWHVHRARKAACDVRAVLRAWIAPRHASATSGGDPGRDVLGSLLRPPAGPGAHVPGLDALTGHVAMAMFCSHEQMGSTLAWGLHLVAHSPRVQHRLHGEATLALDPATGGACGAAARSSSMSMSSPLASNVLRETLRLYPPIGFLPRDCTHAQSLRDKMIDAGDVVVVSPWLIHRHACLWARPDEFDPDRYEHAMDRPSASESLATAFLPFGLGPRACPGRDVAQVQLVTMIGTLARALAFTPVEGEVPQPEGRFTVRPAGGIRLAVRARGAATKPAFTPA